MARVGSFCVDGTEVTNEQYAAFLSAGIASTDGGSVACAWNETFAPDAGWPAAPGAEKLPVAFVDWCDAAAFCAWAGKRLCGRIGGGPISPTEAANANANQWLYACSVQGSWSYPYGSTYDGGSCNGADMAGPEVPRPVGTIESCQSYPGVFDLSGNVAEWTDCCNAATGSQDACEHRGGAYNTVGPSGSPNLSCNAKVASGRSFVGPALGFRCCAD
jgi:sulfatase modifying factor 1